MRGTTILLLLALGSAAASAEQSDPITVDDIADFQLKDVVSCGAKLTAEERASAMALAGLTSPETASLSDLHGITRSIVRKVVKSCDDLPPSSLLMSTNAVAPPTTSVAASLNESAILWGLTEFLLRRASKELNAWALDSFRDELCSDKQVGVVRPRELLANTCPILGDARIDLIGGLATLRAALRKDLEAAPRTVPSGLIGAEEQLVPCNQDDLIQKATCIEKRARVRQLVIMAAFVGTLLERNIQGDPLLRAALELPDLDPSRSPIGKVSFAAPDKGGDVAARVVISVASILQAIVVQQDGRARFAFPAAGDGGYGRRMLLAVLVNASDVQVAHPEARDSSWAGSSRFQAVRESVVAVLAVSGWVNEVRNRAERLETFVEEAERLRAQAKTTSSQQAAADLRVAAASLDVLVALAAQCADCQGTSERLAQISRHATPAAAALASADYAGFIVEWLSLMNEMLPPDQLPKELLRAISFAVEVASAKDSDTVAQALDNFAAPLGSYKRKRTTKTSYLFLNAYVGLFGGAETARVTRGDGTRSNDTALAFAPWVPVGGELGWSCKDASYGIFVHVIDVGALAAFRVGNSDVEAQPEIKLKQVFSPGLFFMVGLKSMPLSIGIGASYAPELRKIKEEVAGGSDKTAAAIRYGITAAIDIPLFP